MSNQMISAAEVAKIMDCSTRYGYDIIKRLNQELESKGYIIRCGRVSRKYFYERTGLALDDEAGWKPDDSNGGQARKGDA